MTHYQKLATMIFRIIGLLLLFVGVLIAVLGIMSAPLAYPLAAAFFVVFYSLPLTILGILFFSLSRKLAKWVCFDFDRFDEKK